jgi:hypothetical protein
MWTAADVKCALQQAPRAREQLSLTPISSLELLVALATRTLRARGIGPVRPRKRD